MIKWNEVTWYSKLLSAIFILGIFPAFSFYLGTEYQKLNQELVAGELLVVPAKVHSKDISVVPDTMDIVFDQVPAEWGTSTFSLFVGSPEECDAGFTTRALEYQPGQYFYKGETPVFGITLKTVSYKLPFLDDLDNCGKGSLTAEEKQKNIDFLLRVFNGKALSKSDEMGLRGMYWFGERSKPVGTSYFENSDGSLRGLAFLSNYSVDGFSPKYLIVLISPEKQKIVSLSVPVYQFKELKIQNYKPSEYPENIEAHIKKMEVYLSNRKNYINTELFDFISTVDGFAESIHFFDPEKTFYGFSEETAGNTYSSPLQKGVTCYKYVRTDTVIFEERVYWGKRPEWSTFLRDSCIEKNPNYLSRTQVLDLLKKTELAAELHPDTWSEKNTDRIAEISRNVQSDETYQINTFRQDTDGYVGYKILLDAKTGAVRDSYQEAHVRGDLSGIFPFIPIYLARYLEKTY